MIHHNIIALAPDQAALRYVSCWIQRCLGSVTCNASRSQEAASGVRFGRAISKSLWFFGSVDAAMYSSWISGRTTGIPDEVDTITSPDPLMIRLSRRKCQ